MDFKTYLTEILTTMEVYEETNYHYQANETACVIKYMTGSNYLDSVIQPIQLSIYADDVMAAKVLLDAFTRTYTNTHIIDGTEYATQFYNTPLVLSTGNQIGPNYVANIIVTGTLIISSNVSEIKTVEIDGYEIETTKRNLVYVAMPDTQRKGSLKIASTDVKVPAVKFLCSFISKNNLLCQKLRRLRGGTLDPNTAFNITLTFTDNDTEESYVMKCIDSTLDSENGALPTYSVSFMQ